MKFMTTKKALLAVLLVAILTGLATGALARERGGRGRGHRAAICPCVAGEEQVARRGNRGGEFGRGSFRNNISEAPQEIQDKWAEARQIATYLRAELRGETVDRDRALELRQQHRALMQEISDWRFMQRLDALTSR